MDLTAVTIARRPGGAFVSVKLAGNPIKYFGLGKLRHAKLALRLHPADPARSVQTIATRGQGALGKTTASASLQGARAFRRKHEAVFYLRRPGFPALEAVEVFTSLGGQARQTTRRGPPEYDDYLPVDNESVAKSGPPKKPTHCEILDLAIQHAELSLRNYPHDIKRAERLLKELDDAIRSGDSIAIQSAYYHVATLVASPQVIGDPDPVNFRIFKGRVREYIKRLSAAIGEINPQLVALRAEYSANCPLLSISPISAVFVEADRATTYSVPMVTAHPSATIYYDWKLSLQAVDPLVGVDNNCSNHGVLTSDQAQFVWHHGNTGDPIHDDGCDHMLQGMYGHQGLITVVVGDDRGWSCTATYKGTETTSTAPPDAASNPICEPIHP